MCEEGMCTEILAALEKDYIGCSLPLSNQYYYIKFNFCVWHIMAEGIRLAATYLFRVPIKYVVYDQVELKTIGANISVVLASYLTPKCERNTTGGQLLPEHQSFVNRYMLKSYRPRYEPHIHMLRIFSHFMGQHSITHNM